MSDKHTRIIETAMKLFSKKGYHSTSIQEIAESSGIAKGSIYNYFSSKEDLFLAIFKHYHERLFSKVAQVEQDKTLSERDMFIEQLCMQFQQFAAQKDFIHMQMRQQIIQINDDIRSYMFKVRAEMLNWYCQRIQQLYGMKSEKFLYDMATILSGMMREYMFYIIVEGKEIDFKKLASFIIDRLDDIAAGLTDNQLPLLTKDMMSSYINLEHNEKQQAHVKLLYIIGQIEQITNQANLDDMTKEKALSSIAALKEELKEEKEIAKLVVVESLLLFLRHLDIPGTSKHLHDFSAVMNKHFTN